MDIEDKDYMRSISAEYLAGYNHGRASMLKEILLAIAIVSVVIFLFN